MKQHELLIANHDAYPNSFQLSVQLFLEDAQARNLAPKTISFYRERLRLFDQHVNRPLEQVDALTIRHYLARRAQAGVKPATLHADYRALSAFFSWCAREGLIDRSPMQQVRPPKREQVLKPALTPEQVQNLLTACEGKHWLRLRDRALILLLLDTGLRIHEAHSLHAGDVLQGMLVIRGKGGKQRVVVLSAEVRLAIQRYLKACPFHPAGDSPLWYGQYGALTLYGIQEVVRRAGRRAGLKLGAHQLRRTFATWSLRNGIDLEHLRLLMGHSDYRVLQQYLALVQEDLKRAHEEHSPLKTLRKQKR
ncbi:MAG: tyrosine-type recombinase/integrase [Firmicutes bacterium]|nr:tyrosine-type recombinase/integrase [Bacillota bacterium]